MTADRPETPLTPSVIEESNRKLVRALVRARLHLGYGSRVQMARAMNEHTRGEGPDESAYNRWEENERRVPGWVLPVISELSGLSANQLLAEPGQELPADAPPALVMVMEQLLSLESRFQAQADRIEKLAQSQSRRRRPEQNAANN